MTAALISFPFCIIINYMIFKKLSGGLDLTNRNRKYLAYFLSGTVILLYITIVSKIPKVQLAAAFWMFFTMDTFIFLLLETGLRMIFPGGQKVRIYLYLSISLISSTLVIINVTGYPQSSMLSLQFVLMLLIFLLNYFIYSRITSGLGLSIRKRGVFIIVMWTGFIVFITGEISGNILFIFTGGIWIGIFAITLTLLILEALISLVLKKYRKQVMVFMLVCLFLLTGLSVYQGMKPLIIREFEVPVQNLPDELSGFTIVQLSDLHLGGVIREDYLKDVVNKTNALKPDLVVITGDLLDDGTSDTDKYVGILKQIDSGHGVIAVPGNHEYYAGIDKFIKIASDAEITVLRNSSVDIDNKLTIAGVDDTRESPLSNSGAQLSEALQNYDGTKPWILLSHRPDIFPEAVEKGVNLQLSGHTHAGQIPPVIFIVYLYYDHPYGFYKEGNSYLYTTCGTGVWGMRMRLFSRSEIAKFVLVKKN